MPLSPIWSILLQQQLIEEDPKKRSDRKQDERGRGPAQLFREMSPALKRLLVSDILVRFCEQIPYAFVVVWCMKIISAPVTAVEFGVLTTVEMATALVIYVPVAYFADRRTKKPFWFKVGETT